MCFVFRESGSRVADWMKMHINGSFSLIERAILSAWVMLIFSVSFQIDQMSEDMSGFIIATDLYSC